MDGRVILKMDMRFLYRDCIVAPIKLLIWDACLLGLPEILTVAHIILL